MVQRAERGDIGTVQDVATIVQDDQIDFNGPYLSKWGKGIEKAMGEQ